MWLSGILVVLVVGLAYVYTTMIRMPGRTYRGALPPLTAKQASLKAELESDVRALAETIGGRAAIYVPAGLTAAADFLDRSLTRDGYKVRRQSFPAGGQNCDNLEVEIQGATRPDEIVIVGAHYDSCGNLPAADDNASGAAAVLALARAFKKDIPAPSRTLRFVLFANEEPPFFQTDSMGSLVYARECRRRRENVVAMLSLETIAYYDDAPGSQGYPLPLYGLYPSTGDFIGFIGNTASRGLVRSAVGSFRRHARFPSEGAALPGAVPGVGWSDHWSFWQVGYPAVMVTDTAPFRNPNYHSPGDTPATLDFGRTARVVDGLLGVIADLASPGGDGAKFDFGVPAAPESVAEPRARFDSASRLRIVRAALKLPRMEPISRCAASSNETNRTRQRLSRTRLASRRAIYPSKANSARRSHPESGVPPRTRRWHDRRRGGIDPEARRCLQSRDLDPSDHLGGAVEISGLMTPVRNRHHREKEFR